MRYLLDTNIIFYILRKRAPTLARLAEAVETGAVFLGSDVVNYEVRRYLLLKEATRQLQRYEGLTRKWRPVGLEAEDWRAAARQWAKLHKSGKSIEDRDLLIAITAMKGDAILVTNNVRHFESLGIPLLNWAEGMA